MIEKSEAAQILGRSSTPRKEKSSRENQKKAVVAIAKLRKMGITWGPGRTKNTSC